MPAPQNLHVFENSVSYNTFIVGWDAMGVGREIRYQVVLMAEDRIVLREEISMTSVSSSNLAHEKGTKTRNGSRKIVRGG